jgi:hypothetical protein
MNYDGSLGRTLLVQLARYHHGVMTMKLARLTVLATLLLSRSAFAGGAPVALVEEVTGAPGVEFMDYVEAGRVIPLHAQESVVLGYLYSCVRETITGGVITVGKEQSEVQSGKVVRTATLCDTGRMILSAQLASQSAGTVVRNVRSKPAESKSPPASQFILYGLSPMVELRGGGGTLEITRVDRSGERYVFTIGNQQLLRNAFYDLADVGLILTAGGVYRAAMGSQGVTFRIDTSAKAGKTPIVGRLVRFDGAP